MIQRSKHLSRFSTITFCLLASWNALAQTPIPAAGQGNPIQAPDIRPRVIPQRDRKSVV